ncbi:MAG: ABC transporter ATP-binding protein, partial [Gammaproteobacteria bacterium]
EGEILALLGPNGAGKTTLISIICGIVSASSGSVTVAGHDIVTDYRVTRNLIGLVPQELTLGAFDTVWNTVNFSRGLFGKKSNPAYLEQLLRDLSLWDKKNNELRQLSGGMKRRVLIAKALSHEPRILFLDEPTAGVDVELRQDMWKMVRRLNDSGVTIILTTHYIEEAEEIADRVGIIDQGELLLVDDKQCLMQKLGKKQLLIELKQSIDKIPAGLESFNLESSADGNQLTYTYDPDVERTGITALLKSLNEVGIVLKDLQTSQSSLEEIFVRLVNTR